MGDTAEGSWTSSELLGFIRREEARKEAMSTHLTESALIVTELGTLDVPIHTAREIETRIREFDRLRESNKELLEACQLSHLLLGHLESLIERFGFGEPEQITASADDQLALIRNRRTQLFSAITRAQEQKP